MTFRQWTFQAFSLLQAVERVDEQALYSLRFH